jgi:hypothetical protein
VSRAIVGSISLLALFGAMYAGCTRDFDQFEPSGGAASTGTGQGGQGGSGGSCDADTDCDDMNSCTEDACVSGQCTSTPIADGPVPGAGEDVPTDCVNRMCVAGVDQSAPDNAEVPDDGNPCTSDTCSAGAPVHMNEPADTSCGGKLVCDGMGNCVGCTKPNQCPDTGTNCKAKTCVDKVCGTMNVDPGTACQGGVCDAMGACVECLVDSDCLGAGSPTCKAGVCVDMCKDGTKNGNETDVDCGGGVCPVCADGKACSSDGDCMSTDCSGNVCVSCMDKVKNGDETDVDCGGSCPNMCADGKACSSDGDCMSDDCSGNVCVSCMDNVKNGSESDVDCGDSCPTLCANGKTCGNNNDCQSDKCSSGTCQP